MVGHHDLLAGHQLIHQSSPLGSVFLLVTGVDEHNLFPQFGAGSQKLGLLGRQLHQAGTGGIGDALGHELGVDFLGQGEVQECFGRAAVCW